MDRSLPRLERFILAKFSTLQQKTKDGDRADLYANQLPQWSNALNADLRELVATPWRLLQDLKRGCHRQWM
jgi:hypothetical protein